MTNDAFKDQLSKITHYSNYPAMMPYVGSNYGANGKPKLLLVAESHYLPEGTTVSDDADHWYNSNQDMLNDEELGNINTKDILSMDVWNNRGHRIFTELNLCLDEAWGNPGPRALTYAAFMNGFQRPSITESESIKDFVEDIDVEVSVKTIRQVAEVLSPDHITFVSKYAWDMLGKHADLQELKEKGIGLDFVCHPGTGGRYWHNPNYHAGRVKFKKLLEGAL
jgi:hypothetical protein